MCECVFVYLFEDILEGKKQSLPKMSRTFAWELLGKANSPRAMETSWGCAAQPWRLHQAGTTVTPAERPPGKPPGTWGSEPSSTSSKARSDRARPQRSGPHILGRSSAPIRGTPTLNLHMPTRSPRLLGAVW